MASDTVIRDEDKVRRVINSLNFNISDKYFNYSREWKTIGCISSAFNGIEKAIRNIETCKATVSSNISENESISSEIIHKVSSIVNMLHQVVSTYGLIFEPSNGTIDDDGTKPTGEKKPTGRKKPSKKSDMVSETFSKGSLGATGDNRNIFDENIFLEIPENTKIEILGQDQNGYIKVKIGDKEGFISTEVLTKYLTETGQSDLIKEIQGQNGEVVETLQMEKIDKGKTSSKYGYATLSIDKSNEGLNGQVNDKNVINQDHTPYMGKGIAEEINNGKSKYGYMESSMSGIINNSNDSTTEPLKNVHDDQVIDQNDGEIL